MSTGNPLDALPRPACVLFDWDNTLVDNWGAITSALNTTFRAHRLPEWTVEEARQRVAASLRDSFPGYFGDRWEEARTLFYEAFAKGHLEALEPLPGADQLTRGLKKRGIPMGLVSNKSGRFLRAETTHLGWDDRFISIVGAGDAERDKPDPAPVAMALAPLNRGPGDDIWFIGDSVADRDCARFAGLSCIMVGDNLAMPQDSDETDGFTHLEFIDCADLARHIWEWMPEEPI